MKICLFLVVLLIGSVNSLLEAEESKEEQYYPQLGLSFSLDLSSGSKSGYIGGGLSFFYSFNPRLVQDIGFSYYVTLSNSRAALSYRATVREFSYYTRIRLNWRPLLSCSPKIWDPFFYFTKMVASPFSFSAFGIGGSTRVYDGKYISETKELFFLEFMPRRIGFVEPSIRYAPFDNKWSLFVNFSFDIFFKKERLNEK